MPEEKVWSGSPSQIKNVKPFIACAAWIVVIVAVRIVLARVVTDAPPWVYNAIFSLVLVPLAAAAWRWLRTRSEKFELTTERLLVTSGVINVVTRSLELYRVKDIRIEQPWFQRIFGLENVELTTSEVSAPFVSIDHIPKSAQLADTIRARVEACRVAKGTRDVEMNSNP
jgi:uncharacterized membrane protein YdbT with pleckstrin-like domain